MSTTTGWWYTNPSETYNRQLGQLGYVGISIVFPKYGNMKFMFQTTNQSYHIYIYIIIYNPCLKLHCFAAKTKAPLPLELAQLALSLPS